jgi:hypothetical protein
MVVRDVAGDQITSSLSILLCDRIAEYIYSSILADVAAAMDDPFSD